MIITQAAPMKLVKQVFELYKVELSFTIHINGSNSVRLSAGSAMYSY